MDGTAFRGAGPALVTPMKADGSVDLDAFALHVEWMLDEGVHMLVPCGTTGESATMTPDEQATVIRRCVEVAGGRVPVLAGAGGNDTAVVAALAREAVRAGADGVLTVTPYYNKPTPDGLVAHYRAVAEACHRPVVVYNVPGRTALNVTPDVLLRIAAEVPGVVGVKEASGDVSQVMTILSRRPEGFTVLSGDDELTLALMALGADGIISVAANEAPRGMARLCEALVEGHMDEARRLHGQLLPLMRANFIETNPIPVKTALEIMGRGEAHFRLPLVPMSAGGRTRLEHALHAAEVLP
jgi:4-hydroxy-tetrahydrodipicolinate synthase